MRLVKGLVLSGSKGLKLVSNLATLQLVSRILKLPKLAILKNWPLPGAVQVGQCSEERVDTPQCQPE